MTARETAEALRDLLPAHTFRAVVKRAATMNSDIERQEFLASVLEERHRSEGK
jgi:hypothetical protein